MSLSIKRLCSLGGRENVSTTRVVPGAVALLATVAEFGCEVHLVKRDGTDMVTIDGFVAKTKCK